MATLTCSRRSTSGSDAAYFVCDSLVDAYVAAARGVFKRITLKSGSGLKRKPNTECLLPESPPRSSSMSWQSFSPAFSFRHRL